MDAATLCALMLKAKLVFGSDQTFLSFPLSPVPFSPKDLDFFDQSSAEAARAGMRAQIDFSRQVNMIPTGEAWRPTDTGFLWDSFLSVLNESDVAQALRTPTEEAAYQSARSLLRDGNGGDTEIVKTYKQHRDASIVAREKYLAAKLTAESAAPSEREKWRSTDEPLLKAELDTADLNWMLVGNKTKVEDAQNLIAILGARSPSQTMAEWRSRCNPDIDQLTDPSDRTSAFPTSFSPANAVEENAWCRFTLSPPEIAALLAAAPADWRHTMLGDAPTSTTQSMSFEFSSAALVRPWFDQAAFRSRFWRFSDSSRLLSDGHAPPTGECTAYAAGLIFARRVRTVDSASPAGTDAGPQFSQFLNLQFKVAALAPQAINMKMRSREGALRADFTAAAPSPAIAAVRFDAVAREQRPALFMAAVRRPVAVEALDFDAQVQRENVRKMKRLSGISVFRPPVAASPLPPPSVSPPATPAAAPPAIPLPPDNTIYVLAFICKRLGKSPDPDSSLSWQ